MGNPRFSVTMREEEINEVGDYSERTGVGRNELMRRAALAYVRLQEGKGEDIKKLFQGVGLINEPTPVNLEVSE